MSFRSIKIRQSSLRRLSWRDIRKPRTVIAVVAFIVLYIEYLDCFLNPLFWPSENCVGCYRVLLVADPQLGGEQDEPEALLRWDSDRYLRKWYWSAYSHVSPHAVIFLGDLMDEGSKATDYEFQRYVARFFDIFPMEQGVKYLYLPGDNDVGGEDGEPILPHVVQRFFHAFSNTSGVTLGSVQFLKVNVPLEVAPTSSSTNNNANVTIVLSHFPLISIGAFSRTPYSVKRFRPSLVISAHSHLSELRRFGQFDSSVLNKVYVTLRPNTQLEEVNEITVPTCSYRMGVSRMGYGSLVIDPTQKEVSYAVLWLPERFFQLYILATCLLILVVYFLLWCKRVS